MPGSFTDYLEAKLLDFLFGSTPYPVPATLHLAAFITLPTDAGPGTGEVIGNAYARVAIANSTANFPGAVGGLKSNGLLINFPQASGAWGSIVAVGFFDAATAGNLLIWGELAPPKTIATGDTLQIAAGGMSITLT